MNLRWLLEQFKFGSLVDGIVSEFAPIELVEVNKKVELMILKIFFFLNER